MYIKLYSLDLKWQKRRENNIFFSLALHIVLLCETYCSEKVICVFVCSTVADIVKICSETRVHSNLLCCLSLLSAIQFAAEYEMLLFFRCP